MMFELFLKWSCMLRNVPYYVHTAVFLHPDSTGTGRIIAARRIKMRALYGRGRSYGKYGTLTNNKKSLKG